MNNQPLTNLNLDNPFSPGGPGTAELVPSRYALKVGDIDVLVISDGVLPLPSSTLATNASPADLAAWLDDMRQPPDVFKWPLNVVVVRSGGRTVLVDAGIGEEIPADFPQAAGLLAGRRGRGRGCAGLRLQRPRRCRSSHEVFIRKYRKSARIFTLALG